MIEMMLHNNCKILFPTHSNISPYLLFIFIDNNLIPTDKNKHKKLLVAMYYFPTDISRNALRSETQES